MKVLNKRKIFIIIPAVFLVLSVCFMANINEKSRLDETQIAVLREKYPVCGLEVPAGLSMKKLSLAEVKSFAETFVYGEVVGDFKTYTVNLSTGNNMLDEKRKENGISEEYEFYEYIIEVINDTEGKREKGEKITISANAIFKDYNPKLSDGMKVVVPVVKDESVSDRNHYIVDGMYYVTPDGYAISAFEESTTYSRNTTSGVTVDELLRQLKK